MKKIIKIQVCPGFVGRLHAHNCWFFLAKSSDGSKDQNRQKKTSTHGFKFKTAPFK